jgi:hypothetical protein
MLIQSYLSCRYQRVRIRDEWSSLSHVTSGTPQGGILSALLFSMFIDDLSKVVDIGFHLYADDSQLYCSAPRNKVADCVELMNASLSCVHSWAVENSLSINPKKSKALIVSTKKVNNIPPVMIGLDEICFCDKLKILGLVVDSKLSWVDHVSKICREINGGLSMLRKSQFITPPVTRKRLVQVLLVPKLMYCSNIFMSCSREQWNQIDRCFNSCTRYVFGLKRFDSVRSHKNDILGCSIENFVLFRACLFMFSLINYKTPSYLYEKLCFPNRPRNGVLNPTVKSKNPNNHKSFFVYGIRLWNSLNSKLRSKVSFVAFRQECLTYFASKNP